MRKISIKKLSMIGVFAFMSSSAFAAIKGDVNGIFIKDGYYAMPVWACVESSSAKPTITFKSGGTTLGTIVPSETSEPEIATACSNSETTLRATFSIPSGYPPCQDRCPVV